MNFNRLGKLGLFIGFSVLLSGFPMVLAAPLLRVVRASFSALVYWTAYPLVALVLWFSGFQPLAIGLIAITLLVGLFFELEKRTLNMYVAGSIAIAVASVASVSATQQWLSSKGLNLETKVREQVVLLVDEAKKIGGATDVQADVLMAQLPSGVIGFFILALAMSLILENPVRTLFQEWQGEVANRNLKAFKLPDTYIWIAMLSFLFSFLELNNVMIATVASNIFNVMVVLYFFQGLAVIESLFKAIRMGSFLKIAIYMVLLVQLFFLVAAVGIIDFWVDIRKRLIKRRQPSA